MKLKSFVLCLCAVGICSMSLPKETLAAGLYDDNDVIQDSEYSLGALENNNDCVPNYKIDIVKPQSDMKIGSVKVSEGTASRNVQLNGYNGSYHASPMYSYLYESGGYLYRIEYIKGKIIFEKYNSDFKLLEKDEIVGELPIFGGFFAGENYNFIIFGDKNLTESNDKEIMRVVKYTKKMERVDSKSFYGCNTYIPFDAGCPRMDEYNDILYIHASHEMYKTSDGFHHQANMDFYIKISDMTTIYSNYNVSNPSKGYMSHSFNQFIKVNKNGIYTVDHGDAYNRAITVFRRANAKTAYADFEDVFKIKGRIGENYTGVCVGGMELSENNMLIAGTSVPQDSSFGKATQKNLFVVKAPMYDDGKLSVNFLTHYDESADVTFSEPKLVKRGSDSFVLLWTETTSSGTSLYAAQLDGNGKITKKIAEFDGVLSDCQPILFNGKVVYYATQGDAPVFYYL